MGDANGVNAVRIKNVVTGDMQNIELQGVFLSIGNIPNTTLFSDQLELVDNYIKIKSRRRG